MTCDEFENLLQEVLDRRETPSADPFLATHARVCTGCQRKVTLYEALFDGLELAETPALGSDFSRQASRAAQVRRKWNWKKTAGICAAVAASLLVMVAIANRNQPGEPADAPNHVAESGSQENESRPDRRERERQPAQEKDDDATSLAIGSPGSRVEGQPPAERPVVANSHLDELLSGVREDFANVSLAETGAATARLPGVRPLTSSLTAGFSAIRQTLPGGKNEDGEPPKPQAHRFQPQLQRSV